jgi:hypothetical protein
MRSTIAAVVRSGSHGSPGHAMSPAATTTGYLPESRLNGRPDGSVDGSQAPAAKATTTTVTMDVQRADAGIDGVGQTLAPNLTLSRACP